MSNTFKTSDRRKWSIDLNFNQLIKVHQRLGIDLLQVTESKEVGGGLLVDLCVGKSVVVWQIVLVLIEDKINQVPDDDVTFESVANLLDMATLKQASDALIGALQSFFGATSIETRTIKAINQQAAEISKIKTQMIEEDESSGDTSTNSQESQELTTSDA